MVHAECCGVVFADDCQNCQAGGFSLFSLGGHCSDEVARYTGNITRNTESETYPNAFRLTPGANFSTNDPEYAAAAAVAGPGVRGGAKPGVRGDDLAARLAGPG